MTILRIVLTVIMIIISIIMTVIILMQEGKNQGLGSIGGLAESYWGKIRGRSVEGTLEKLTRVAAVLFLLLAFVLNLVK